MGLSSYRKLRYAAHDSADLFTAPTGSGSQSWVFLKAESIEPTWDTRFHDRKFLASDSQHFKSAIGEKIAGIKFSTEAIGNSAAGAGSAVQARGSMQSGGSPSASENGGLLKSVFGNETLDTGNTFAAGASALSGYDDLVLTSATNFTVGGFIGFNDANDGKYYVRHVRAKSSNTLSCYPNLPAAAGLPANTEVAYASAWYTRAESGWPHLGFDFETADTAHRRQIHGCLGNMALKNTAANGKAMFEWEFRGVDWAQAALGIGTVSYVSSPPAQGAIIRNTRVYIATSSLLVSEFEFNLGNEIQPKMATRATNGIDSYVIPDAAREFSFKMEYADGGLAHTLYGYWQAGTRVDLFAEMTQGGPGNSFAIAAPSTEIVSMKPTSVNGLDYIDVKLRALRASSGSLADIYFGVV